MDDLLVSATLVVGSLFAMGLLYWFLFGSEYEVILDADEGVEQWR